MQTTFANMRRLCGTEIIAYGTHSLWYCLGNIIGSRLNFSSDFGVLAIMQSQFLL